MSVATPLSCVGARGHDDAANAGLSQMKSSPWTLIAEGQRNWL